MNRTFIGLGSIFGFLSVALGAFGAHALKASLAPDMLANYQTGVQYQMMHSLGLIAVGLASSVLQASGHLRRAGWAMAIGIVVFSGSLYILSITGIKALGAITPIGGVAFLFGWLSFALAAWQKSK
ncbi:DUF423 domain-containing protein [Paenibacillus allorhizosphaerae]|uniref:DUF423 domain-containing protein n=1 Tax=Paenibacillus allorhizosphaerae TaxID=2849866 RepID=A0ABM8VEM8_9BACL|nr:DUF423 domain-containing protein [Paenibacillus allorhizosphaerae]CAG7631806.1 hypothetical protein PAECIP111802_01782 [Paenibacillus allorhizosphaerae]